MSANNDFGTTSLIQNRFQKIDVKTEHVFPTSVLNKKSMFSNDFKSRNNVHINFKSKKDVLNIDSLLNHDSQPPFYITQFQFFIKKKILNLSINCWNRYSQPQDNNKNKIRKNICELFIKFKKGFTNLGFLFHAVYIKHLQVHSRCTYQNLYAISSMLIECHSSVHKYIQLGSQAIRT